MITVSDLIAKLQHVPQNLPVVVDGHTVSRVCLIDNWSAPGSYIPGIRAVELIIGAKPKD